MNSKSNNDDKQKNGTLPDTKNPTAKQQQQQMSIPALAIIVWYSLGVVSIATSKLLLNGIFFGKCSPLMLTCQQFWIGTWLLSSFQKPKVQFHQQQDSLRKSGLYFSTGFFLTNVSFFSSNASFVETIKAAEPLSSASIAKLWGTESSISSGEVMSLLGITCGVILSTIGNATKKAKQQLDDNDSNDDGGLMRSTLVCVIVLIANCCFCLRGMYQKLFLEKHNEKKKPVSDIVSDVDLQFCMQSVGFRLFIIPTLLWEGQAIFSSLTEWSMKGNLPVQQLFQYILLAIANSIAFTGYNLASTYVLSRISVVHHAAWNCVRRIFAIVITSILFQVPISTLSMYGIAFSILSFFSYSRFKRRRLQQQSKKNKVLSPTVQKNDKALQNV